MRGLPVHIDIDGDLEFCGADAMAPEGSQGHTLATIAAAVAEVRAAKREWDDAHRALGDVPLHADAGAAERRCEAACRRLDIAIARLSKPPPSCPR